MKYLKRFESQDEEDWNLTTFEKLEQSILEYDEVEDIEKRIKDFLNDESDDADLNKGDESLLKPLSGSIMDNEWTMEVMDVLVKYGCDVNYYNKYGEIVLFNFSETNDEELFEYLLKLGADIENRDHSGKNVLAHYLDKYGKDLEFFKFMVEKGADIKNIDKHGQSLLFLSVSSENIFDYLLENIDPDIIDSTGNNALCGKKYILKYFKKLLEKTDNIGINDGYIFKRSYGALMSYFQTYSFQRFIAEKHPNCFKYLIENDINIDKNIAEEYDYLLSGSDMGLM